MTHRSEVVRGESLRNVLEPGCPGGQDRPQRQGAAQLGVSGGESSETPQKESREPSGESTGKSERVPGSMSHVSPPPSLPGAATQRARPLGLRPGLKDGGEVMPPLALLGV